MILLLILLVVLAFVSVVTRLEEPENFTEVRKRYAILRDYVKNNPVPEKFKVLDSQILLIGYLKKKHELGYNTNKGYEIGLCLDGTVNQIFHVLLHELAHSTVREYSHSKEFWENFNQLKEICVKLGIYTRITQKRRFCNKYIVD